MSQVPTKVVRVTLETYDVLQLIKDEYLLDSFDEAIRFLGKRAL